MAYFILPMHNFLRGMLLACPAFWQWDKNGIICKVHTSKLHFLWYLPSKEPHNVLSICQLDEQKQHQSPRTCILFNGNQLPLSVSTSDASPNTPGISSSHQVSVTSFFHIRRTQNQKHPNAGFWMEACSQFSSALCFSLMCDYQATCYQTTQSFISCLLSVSVTNATNLISLTCIAVSTDSLNDVHRDF